MCTNTKIGKVLRGIRIKPHLHPLYNSPSIPLSLALRSHFPGGVSRVSFKPPFVFYVIINMTYHLRMLTLMVYSMDYKVSNPFHTHALVPNVRSKSVIAFAIECLPISTISPFLLEFNKPPLKLR